MKKITLYKTEDGKTFESMKEAFAHERDVKAEQSIREILNDAIRTGRVESVIKQMLVENVALRNVLGKYHKNCQQSAKRA